MSWIPSDFSTIHDHGSTQWGAIQYFGKAEHAVFAIEDDLLTTRSRLLMEPGGINEVDHSLIHQMGNLDEPPFCSLHLYGPEADSPTTLRHHKEMLNRIRRMLPSSEDPEALGEKARALEEQIRSLEVSSVNPAPVNLALRD